MILAVNAPAPSCEFCDADIIGYSHDRHRHEYPTTNHKGEVTGQAVAIICDKCLKEAEDAK